MAVGLCTIQDPYFTLNPYIMLHKFIYLLATTLVLFVSIVRSQSLENRIKSTYSPLEPYTPTGILYDRSPLKLLLVDSMSPALYYPGSSIVGTQFRYESLYNLFYHASFTGSPFTIHPGSLPKVIDSLRLGYDENSVPWPQLATMSTHCDVVMGSLLLNYNKIHPQAFHQNLIYLNAADNKFYLRLSPYTITDTLWISGQPGVGNYTIQTVTITPDTNQVLNGWKTTEELFSFAALTPYAIVEHDAPVRYYFPENLNLANWPGHQLEVDFQDGQGFVLVQPGQIKSIIYAESGVKMIRARIKNSQGQIIGDLPSSTFVRVLKAKYTRDQVFTSDTILACNIDQSDGNGQALLSFKYAPASNGKLMNPFILVEGFESKEFSKTNPEVDNRMGNGFGLLNWISITSGVDPEEYSQLSRLPDLVDSLLSHGYDVGYVDLRTNRAIMQKNANALISLLQKVQSQLLLNGSSNGVQLMGASMGGVISRIALVKLEQNDCCHPVKNYFSFSAPHLGANIPIAAQHLTYDLGNRFNYLNLLQRSKLAYSQVLNSPAARQLLLVHREHSARSEHQNFYQYLGQIGQPQLVKKIAITDGSINGFLHRIDNSNLNSPILQDLQNLFEFALKLPAPTRLLTFYDFPIQKFIVSSALGKAIEHSPNSVSNNWVYGHGRDIEANLDDLWDQNVRWFEAVVEYAAIELFHEAAKYIYPQLTIPITISGNILKTLSETRSNGILDQRLQNNHAINATYSLKYLSHASEGFDNAPADFNNTIQSIVKPFQEFGAGFAFNNVFPTASFVPSTSAFDDFRSTRSSILDSNSTYTSIKFDYCWARITNLKNEFYNYPHVSTSVQFGFWVIDALKKLNDSSKYLNSELNNASYNYAPLQSGNVQYSNYYNSYESISSLKIRNNANLYFNRMVPVGFLLQNNQQYPTSNSHIKTRTRNFNCTPVIVQNEGTIELGEPASSPFTNSAHVLFRTGSVLELYSNSVLNIHQGSKLTVDSGATLIIHPNATVYLEGNNSILEIKGRVVFLPNATLELTGGGYVLVNQDSGQVANIFNLWEAQGPAGIRFHGLQSNQRLMELASTMRLSSRIKFNFKTGRINMHPATMLDIYGDADLQAVLIQSTTAQAHRGIYLHGQPNVSLNSITISGGEPAITSTMIQFRNPLVLNNCNLSNNALAVVTYGGQVNFTSSTFNSNSTAWMAYDMDGNSRVEACQFNANNVAIDIMGQHDANLYITQSTIEHNVWGIKSFGQLYCRMNCSSVSNNTTGIYAGNYQWLLGGRARNRFHNNQIAIRLEEVDNFFVFEGENDFSGSQMYFTGTFSGVAMNYLHLNPMTNGYELNVKDNRLPVVSGNTRVHLRDWNDDPIYLYNHTPMPTYMALCEAVQTIAFEDYVLQHWNSNILVDVNQNQVPLNQAVAQARSMITTNELQNTKTDLEAINQFDVILSQVRNQSGTVQITSNDYVILEIALNKMMEAHNNAYRFGLIPRIRAVDDVPKSPYLTAILDEIDARITTELLNNSSEKLIYSLMLSKAQVYRTAEHYDYALEALAELKLANDPFWSATADYWECICTAESELIREITTAEAFEETRIGCLMLGPNERRSQPIMIGDLLRDNTTQLEYTLFPNPVTDHFFLSTNQLIGSAEVQILDLMGRLIHKKQWPDKGDIFEFDTKTLSPGLYIARIYADDKVESLRFTKQ